MRPVNPVNMANHYSYSCSINNNMHVFNNFSAALFVQVEMLKLISIIFLASLVNGFNGIKNST